MNRIRVGVIGAGSWGLNHIRIVASEPGCELASVVDPDPSALATVRSLAPLARQYADAEELLEDPAIDAVVISSPSATHAPLARAALTRGKHVLVEKPMATSLADATQVALHARGAIAMVGHLLVYHPAIQHIQHLVRSGVLGDLRYLRATRVNQARVREENVWWSLGPHDLSVLDVLISAYPETVAVHAASHSANGVSDVAFAVLRYPDGVLAELELSWRTPRKERRFSVVGARAMVELDDLAGPSLQLFEPSGPGRAIPLPSVEPLRVQFQHFLACIRSDRRPSTEVATALRVMHVLEAGQRSMEAGGAPIALNVVRGSEH